MRNDSSENTIRVRFAPSPTGYLHVGGARTALYNWLYARHNNGSFIVRIEDTDRSRSTDESIKEIIDGLKWLGLHWDEGADETGERGEYGPYRQIERLSLYKEYSEILQNEGRAYPCWCTPEELADDREAFKKEGKPYKYSGKCRNLNEDKKQRLRTERGEAAIRFAFNPEERIAIQDMIRGQVIFDTGDLGDFVIVRTDGIPTYNFAVVIDDLLMKMTHVIRGEDHLSNTPKQVAIFRALSKPPPRYAHLPMIVGSDRKPLSKRHGSVSIREFRKEGFLPEALMNYLALLGWSYDDATTIFRKDYLVEAFGLEKVGKSAALFDNAKLLWMNGHYIRESTDDYVMDALMDFSPLDAVLTEDEISVQRELTAKIVPYIKEKIKTLKEYAEIAWFFYRRPNDDQVSALLDTEAINSLKLVLESLKGLETFELEEIENALRKLADDTGLKPKQIFQPIRFAISGQKITPGIFETLFILGREESLFRLERAINRNS